MGPADIALWKESSQMLPQILAREAKEEPAQHFKRKVLQEDIIKDTKRHSFYLKPGEKKRVKSALARKRNRKKRIREAVPAQAR